MVEAKMARLFAVNILGWTRFSDVGDTGLLLGLLVCKKVHE